VNSLSDPALVVDPYVISPEQTFKSLQELKIEYDNSVGHSANLLLGLTPDYRYIRILPWIP